MTDDAAVTGTVGVIFYAVYLSRITQDDIGFFREI